MALMIFAAAGRVKETLIRKIICATRDQSSAGQTAARTLKVYCKLVEPTYDAGAPTTSGQATTVSRQ